MTSQKASARRCSWHHCSQPAVATVPFELPNLLAGSRRDYCREHISQVCLARGTVLVARLGARQPVLPGPGWQRTRWQADYAREAPQEGGDLLTCGSGRTH